MSRSGYSVKITWGGKLFRGGGLGIFGWPYQRSFSLIIAAEPIATYSRCGDASWHFRKKIG
jgi:hypothetical protein